MGYQPVAWRQGEQVYALQTDQRGAVTAVAELGSDADKPLWRSHINTWGALPVSGADKQPPHLMDPGLRLINQLSDPETGLSYHIARYYDSRTGRFISPDPAGVADSLDERTPNDLKLDLTAYVSGQPLFYFDPDGAAKITYFAITTGDKGQALGQTQGFTRARWAFVIEDIRPGGNANTDLGKLRKQYAQNGTQLLFDAGGNFISGFGNIDASKNEGNTALRWDKGSADNVLQAFASHYGNNRISATQFTINDVDDDNAARLIWYLSASAAVRKTCAATAPGWLPEIKFAAEEYPIQVTRQGFSNPANSAQQLAQSQRIVACKPGSDADVLQRRLQKYNYAAMLLESSPSQISKDCSRDACPGQNLNGTVLRGYVASYGRSQFILTTMLDTLKKCVPTERSIPTPGACCG